MDYLQQLLNNQPVEWKKLGEVCTRTSGTKITAGKMKDLHKENAPIKIFAGGKTIAFVDYGDIPQKDIYTTPSVIVKSRGIIEVEYYDKPFSHKSEMWSYASKTSELDTKFLYYYLKTLEFDLQRVASKMQMPQIAISDTESLPIPIPPLSVQSRIVEILDKFTAMEAELEEQLQAELELRKKQYAYYREQLLNFSYTPPSEFNVVYRKLGEMAELVRGNGLSKKDFAPEGIPAIHYGQIYTYYGNETKETISFVTPETASKLRKVFCGNVVITNTSENLEDVGKALLYSGKSEAVTGGHATIIRCSEHLLPKFFVYYTKTRSFFDQKRKLAKGTKVIDVSATDLARIEIPIPPLSEQQRIVEMLDKFDTLTSSISEGLPLEIKLRRQQYEYYREQLLDFRR